MVLSDGERELDRQWSKRYTYDVRRLEGERDAARRRASALRAALNDALGRLQRAGDHTHADLLRVLDAADE